MDLHSDGVVPARVVSEQRGEFSVLGDDGERTAELSGRLRHEARSRAELPAVGDWVAVRPRDDHGATIVAVLPRQSAFVRAVAGGTTDPQLLAANIDVAWIVCACGADLNPRRLERYLTAVHTSGARAVIALTKTDVCAPDPAVLDAVMAAAGRTAVHRVSSVTGDGIEALVATVHDHETVALFGSSGAGKSTLVNRIAGATVRATGPMGADGRGQHTTTGRQLVSVGRVLVLDTPGLRELRLWDAGDGLDDAFGDIAALAERCRFRDCAHDEEPGCAVREGIATGALSPSRLQGWIKLQREVAAFDGRKDVRARLDAKRRMKTFARAARVRDRHKG